MLNFKPFSQRGLTVIELMVGMTVGLIVVGMVLSVYLTTVRSSGATLKSSRLNQEMGAIMSIMVNDIRRAGYGNPMIGNRLFDWDCPNDVCADPDKDGDNIEEPSTNPFNLAGSSALEVRNDMINDAPMGPTGVGECILYAYDASNGDDGGGGDSNGDGYRTRENNEFFGFRLHEDDVSVQMRTSVDIGAGGVPNSCASDATQNWLRINDPAMVEITSLQFDLRFSSCINVSEPNTVDDDTDGYPDATVSAGDVVSEMDEVDCYTTIPGVNSEYKTVERRDVEITMVGRLADDHDVQMTMKQRVSIRNDLIRIR